MAALGYHYPYELFQHEEDGWPQAREWAYLIRHVNFVRYVFPAAELYKKLLKVLEGTDFFAVTSNADRQLMRAGFPMDRVFEAQGSYDRLSCTARCTRETWEIKPYIDKLLPLIDPETFMISDESAIPYCPYCGAPLYTAFRGFERLQGRGAALLRLGRDHGRKEALPPGAGRGLQHAGRHPLAL